MLAKITGNGSTLRAAGLGIIGCQTGLYVDDGGAIMGATGLLQMNQTAIYVGPNGTSTIDLSSMGLIGNGVNMSVQATQANVNVSGSLDDSSIVNPNNVDIALHTFWMQNAYKYHVLTSNVVIGTAEIPSSTVMGQGTFYRTKYTYPYTTGALFSTTDVDDCSYFGSDRCIQAIKFNVTTPATSGSTTFEYYNGTAWVALKYATTDGSVVFASAQKQMVNFDSYIPSTITVNGVSALWIRARITVPLNLVPVSAYVKMRGNCAKVASNGTLQFFGSSRFRRTTSAGLATQLLTNPVTIKFPITSNIDKSNDATIIAFYRCTNTATLTLTTTNITVGQTDVATTQTTDLVTTSALQKATFAVTITGNDVLELTVSGGFDIELYDVQIEAVCFKL
jgi:hypothetical protein